MPIYTPGKLTLAKGQPVPVDLLGFGSVSLLLHCEGSSITDSSLSPKSITTPGAGNNAALSTTQQKFGDKSIYFDGTGDYVVAANSNDFTLLGDYTIELWIYPEAFGAAPGIFNLGSQTAGSNGLLMYYNSNRLSLYSNGSTILTSSLNPLSTAGSWQHVAVVRSGIGSNNTVLYVNGTSVGATTNNTQLVGVSNNGFCLGAQASTSAFSDATFTGYMDEIRVSRVARYPGSFISPAASFADF